MTAPLEPGDWGVLTGEGCNQSAEEWQANAVLKEQYVTGTLVAKVIRPNPVVLRGVP